MKSLRLNNVEWKVSLLGERALLLEQSQPSVIRETARLLEEAGLKEIIDIIPAYKSMALIYNRFLQNIESELTAIQEAISKEEFAGFSPRKHEVPVCYEMGLDWEEIVEKTGVQKEEIIKRHLQGEYTIAMMGFIPGFLYLSGLDESIACSRKENPRTQIPEGAVGIGGNQTGIYSLKSPGGWQIIGRTPLSFFDVKSNPPTKAKPGDEVIFNRISEAEFSEMKNGNSS